MEKYADLHVHTSFSDSLYTPAQILELGKKAGLSAIGICDHDTVDGVREALDLGDEYGIEVIPGVELSTELDNMEVHILGYYLDWNDGKFNALLKTIREVRVWRAELMVTKLQNLGIDVDFDEVMREVGEGSVGRPHIARVMVKRGFVKSIDEAFEKYLRAGGPAYVGKYEMRPDEAISFIKKLNGIPVLAHMKFSELSIEDFEELVRAGLRGLEVYHSRYAPEETERFLKIAQEYGLLVTGGSDSHGTEDPVGCVKVPYSLVDSLKRERMSLLTGLPAPEVRLPERKSVENLFKKSKTRPGH